MKFYYISISSLSFFPVFKYILEVFLKKSNTDKKEHHLVESHLQGFPDYTNIVKTHYYYQFNSISHFNNMSFIIKVKRYIYISYFVFKSVLEKKTIIYTSDYQVLIIAFYLFKILGKSQIKLIYHQYELIEANKKNILQKIKKNIHYIDLTIFPEINRLNYFVQYTGLPQQKALLFPNTCKLNNIISSKNKILSQFNEDDILIAHIGNTGFNHFFLEIINCFKNQSIPDKYKLIFIGKQSKELEAYLKNNSFRNIYFFKEVPHYELSSIYNFIDYGLILYKPIDLNFDYCAPNKLYEFWAHGVPVMTHQLKGLENIVNENLGIIIDFYNICSDDILRIKKLSNEERKSLKEEFSVKFEVTKFQKQLEYKIKELTV